MSVDHLLPKTRTIEVIKFAIVGIANTAIGLAVIYLMKLTLDMRDVPANMIGYTAGLLTSFALNRNWTFRDAGATVPALLRFIVVFLCAYTANLLVVMGLIRLGINSYVAQAAGILPYTILFFLGSRYLAFRHTRPRL
jgi:putative flippase GtrA